MTPPPAKPRRRWLRIALWALALLLALPILAVAAILLALNTAPGQSFAARQLASLTGGAVRLDGLSGRFPDRLRLAHLEVSDATGPYLTADDIALDWSPTALIHKQALVHRLDAARLDFRRLPASNPPPSTPTTPSKPFTLPVRVTVEHLAIPQATLGAPLLGTEATLALTAKANLPTLETGTATIQATNTAAPGTYTVDANVTDTAITAHLAVDEPEHGIIATVGKLPDIGPLNLQLAIDGPRTALATRLALSAGPLSANADGTIDLPGQSAQLDLHAHAPAMRPAPDIAWQSIALDAHIAGPFTKPDATAQLHLRALQAPGTTLAALDADLSGNAGQVALKATATTLHLPGPLPDLFAATPISLDATARLDDPARPVRFTLSHPLLTIAGTATTADPVSLKADLTLPDLAPLSPLAGSPLAGHTTLALTAQRHDTTTTLDASGKLTLLQAPAPAPTLLGPDTPYRLSATLDGDDITLSEATIAGQYLRLAAQGTSRPAGLDVTARLDAPDLARLAPTLQGNATLGAHVTGPISSLTLDATLAGTIGAAQLPPAPLRLTANLTGLPAAPTGRIAAEGTLAQSPVHLDIQAARTPAGTLDATIAQADWRSFHAEGALTLPPGATLPQGHVALRVQSLADLRPFLAQPLSGALTANLTLGPAAAQLDADLRNAGLPTASVAHATLKAHVATPLDHPTLDATLVADGLAAGTLSGSAKLEAHGPQEAIALRTTADLTASGTQAAIAAAARLDAAAKSVRLDTLTVDARTPTLAPPATLRLLAPATIRFADAVAVDRLRLGLQQATLELSGRLSPTLDANATLRTPAAIAALADPALAPDGTIALDAHLTGPTAHPSGTVRLAATALHLRTGPAAGLPPATLTATATLAGTTARLDSRLSAGSATLALNGQLPIGPGPVALHADGALDLALLNPILGAQGRQARGRLTLDASVSGPLAAPRIAGAAQLSGAEIQDFAQGVHLTDIAATIRAEGDTIRLASLTGRAGPGTIAASGTLQPFAPALPLDLSITLANARPLASDIVTADLDAALTIKGPAATPAVAGRIGIRRATLTVPNTLPASVAVLNVRRPGDKPPPPPSPPKPIPLDLAIDTTGPIFLRGRGIDAVMGGRLHVGGTAAAPALSGGLDMRNGSVSVAGTTLSFTRGKIGFDGTGISGKIDPTLDFLAQSTTAEVTASLAITGPVSAPKITLSSVPALPQDEVLAYLIFKRSAKELGPFQIAEIAAGLAELGGVTGGGANPLDSVRKTLGLDRLSIGSSSSSGSTNSSATSATVEAGRYVANGVYVGAKQGVSGNQTQATVQIDITKGLKLETDAGSGQGGNSVGLTYQFEY